MDPSSNVKSLVRGWLQASPNASRVKLTPPSLVPTFSPRPERLGLGAVPPRDPETRVYKSRLEKRIGRKMKRKADDSAIVSLVEKNLAHDSSDEMCSRSTSIREKHTGGKPAMDASLMNTPRKRKKKKKGAAISTAEFPMSHHSSGVHPIAGLTEDPIPQGRRDILRGGAPQHVNTPAPPLNTEQQLFPVKRKKTHPKLCSDTDCSTNEREMAAIAEEHSGGGVRKRRKRSRQRMSRHRPSFPWSLSSQRYLQGRHQHKRKLRPKGI